MVRLDAQWEIPAGFGSDGSLVNLGRLCAADFKALPKEALSREQRVELARARLQAGEWSTLMICDEEVDRDRAIRELEAGSELGEMVLAISERALAMVIEDAQERGRP